MDQRTDQVITTMFPAWFQLRNDLLGPAGILAILGYVAAVVAVALPTALLLQAADVRYPGTLSMILGGAVLIVGHPVLMRLLRQIIRTRRAGGQ